MTGPGDEMRTPAAGRGRMRASNTEREQVIDTLKAAFVDGRLTKDELDTRVGQTIAARTFAELAAMTADIPATRRPEPVRAVQRRSGNKEAMRAVKTGACVIAALTLTVSVLAGVLGSGTAAAVMAIVIGVFTTLAAAFVAAVIAGVLKLEAYHRQRSGGQHPPRSGSQASRLPSSAEPPAQVPPIDRGQRPTAEAALRHLPSPQWPATASPRRWLLRRRVPSVPFVT
ncbi:MAG TPA: DUF1707 domain-containing protein [Streptosporangiaceae bacterium]